MSQSEFNFKLPVNEPPHSTIRVRTNCGTKAKLGGDCCCCSVISWQLSRAFADATIVNASPRSTDDLAVEQLLTWSVPPVQCPGLRRGQPAPRLLSSILCGSPPPNSADQPSDAGEDLLGAQARGDTVSRPTAHHHQCQMSVKRLPKLQLRVRTG